MIAGKVVCRKRYGIWLVCWTDKGQSVVDRPHDTSRRLGCCTGHYPWPTRQTTLDRATMTEPDQAFTALCEALLMEYGLGETWHGPLDTALDIISPRARAVLEELRDAGYTIAPLEP